MNHTWPYRKKSCTIGQLIRCLNYAEWDHTSKLWGETRLMSFRWIQLRNKAASKLLSPCASERFFGATCDECGDEWVSFCKALWDRGFFRSFSLSHFAFLHNGTWFCVKLIWTHLQGDNITERWNDVYETTSLFHQQKIQYSYIEPAWRMVRCFF